MTPTGARRFREAKGPGAGLAGALKLFMQLRDGAMAPNAQLRALNPHVVGALRGVLCVLPASLAAFSRRYSC